MPHHLPAYNVHRHTSCFSTSVIVSYAQSKRYLRHCGHWEWKNAVSTHSDAPSAELSLDHDFAVETTTDYTGVVVYSFYIYQVTQSVVNIC